jgi:hypothetical protein
MNTQAQWDSSHHVQVRRSDYGTGQTALNKHLIGKIRLCECTCLYTPNPLLKIQTSLDTTHLHSACVADSAGVHGDQVTTHVHQHASKLFTIPQTFPHVFNYFQPRTVKTVLGKTTLSQELLSMQVPSVSVLIQNTLMTGNKVKIKCHKHS